MSPRRARRLIDWDSLERRDCPASLAAPAPQLPISEIPRAPTDPAVLALDKLYLKQATTTAPNVAFYGDSITYNFGYSYGSSVWGKQIAPLNATDFGVSGDMTQDLLWRFDYGGELASHPKVAVVEIGLNNLVAGHETPADTVKGIEAVLWTIRTLSPDTKIVLMGLLPQFGPTDPMRAEIATVNKALAGLAVPGFISYLDIGPSLEAPDGSISANFEPGDGHPNQQGYQIWANDIIGLLDQLLNIAPTPTSQSTPAGTKTA